ncbi:hypothetical protein D3C83_70130 [compost metagenome]
MRTTRGSLAAMPATDATLMIRPRRFGIIDFVATACDRTKFAVMLSATSLSQASIGCFSADSAHTAPALFTRMSILP